MATVADDALAGQSVNRMLGAGADVAQAFQQQILRANADDQRITMSAARGFETTTQLITYVGAQALLGSDPTLAENILSQRSAQAQPQTTGQLVSGPPFNVPAPVYVINPTTGTVSKAS